MTSDLERIDIKLSQSEFLPKKFTHRNTFFSVLSYRWAVSSNYLWLVNLLICVYYNASLLHKSKTSKEVRSCFGTIRLGNIFLCSVMGVLVSGNFFV